MENELIVCQKCGEKNPSENSFCKKCASPLKELAQQTQQQPTPIVQPQYLPTTQPQKTVKKKNGKGCLFAVIGIIVVVIIVVAITAGGGGSKDGTTVANGDKAATTQVAKVPTVVTSDELVNALEENALKAATTYKGKYVELTGKLSNIDSSGKYFSLMPLNDEISFTTILCNIEDEQKDTVMNFKSKQKVTLVGTITDVGEVMGYSLDVESIK